METLALAAISLTIAISILLKRKRPPALTSFAVLCCAVFLNKGATFVNLVSPANLWDVFAKLGPFYVSLSLAYFSSTLLARQGIVTRKTFYALALAAIISSLFLFWPGRDELAGNLPFYFFAGSALLCGLALLVNIRNSSGVERWRMIYVAIACAGALVLSSPEILKAWGISVVPLSDIAISVLIYFILIVLVNRDLPELYLIMARALVIFLLTVFGTVTILVILSLFGKGISAPFTTVLLASFLIVIFIDPLKFILKKILTRMFPGEGKDVLRSLYSFDGEAEKEKTVLLEEMGTVLAHEIRNPLGSIKGAAQFLSSDCADAEKKKLFNIIIEETDRLNEVVSHFLSFARPFAISPTEEQINDVVEKAISLIAMNNRSDRIEIEKDLHPDIPPVLIDREQIIQVILNIALNGIEAMPDGGKLIFRTFRIDSDGRESVSLSIRDTGQGMDKEQIGNIFKPFYSTKKRGIGLGLAICKRIIKNHQGRIRVKSIPGRGSVFYIRFGL
jgi:two-component system, NtrC family, sensor histidine kinase HydH